MTAFRARVLLFSFLLIFAGVTLNAMLLQSGGMPWSNIALLTPDANAKTQKTKSNGRRVRRVLPRWNHETSQTFDGSFGDARMTGGFQVVPEPDEASSYVSVTPTTNAVRETVRATQRELAAHNYEPGPVDGILGVMTRAAIMAYQHDERLTLTATPSEELLERIILGGIGQDPATRRGIPSQHARSLVRGVQGALTRLGYSPGAADGVVSTITARAIKAFERDHNLAPTGRISGRLIAEIGRVSGTRFRIAA
jgi:peptidoglycan hydrolase-like protein with peptidoglycan-binding domain